MSTSDKDPQNARPSKARRFRQGEDLRRRLEEAEQTLQAIRTGDVDAIVVAGSVGDQVYSLTGAEHSYRVIVETMNEAALTADLDGTILFCNQRFCDLMRTAMHEVLGHKVAEFAAEPQRPTLKALMTQVRSGPARQHLTLRAVDGTTVPVLLSASLLQTPDSVSICLVASDLTELEESANSIRVLREQRQALEESEFRFRTIFESSQDAVVITDDDGVCVQANPAVKAIFGLSSEELIGRCVFEFVSDAAGSFAIWQELLDAGRFRGEMPMIGVDGQARHVDAYAVANILPGRHLCVFRDITERKLAEEALLDANERLNGQAEELQMQTEELRISNEGLLRSEERYHRLFEDDLTGNFISTPEGQVLLCNPAFAQIFGFSCVDEAVRVNMLDLYEDARERAPLIEKLKQQQKIERLEAWRKRSDGERIYIVETLVGHFDSQGELRQIKGYIFDDTDRKKAEESLVDLTRTLEARVAERTAELEYRARQLQKLALELSQAEERERRRLAEILHDDLQQQLAAAKFHVGILAGRVKGDIALQKYTAQIDKMLRDAVETSRSLSHELSPAVMYHGDLGEILEWLANQIRTKHGLIVHVDTAGEVSTESDALKAFLYKAVQEMLFNAVKHARVSEARVRVRRMGRCICLSVSDRGRGFNPQDLRQAAGFGLMSIRERIGLLGGRMKIHSVPGEGSRFVITVPDGQVMEGRRRRTEDRSDSSSVPGPSSSDRVLRVLIADDHEIVRHGLASLLAEAKDVELVGEAGNGREAVDLAYQIRPDVVIMDVAMPLMNGDEAARQILRHLPQTRIVALSMYEEPGAIDKMHKAGAESYVLKTASSDELLGAIRGKAQ